METIVRVIMSKEIIKPSSQTPHHLRNLKLSLLDRLVSPMYISIVFFYQADHELINGSSDTNYRAQISEKLKKSLSDTLTTFYPLAGKLNHENFMVECNDAGVMYVEARVHARLTDAIQDPTTKQLKLYLPESTEKTTTFLIALQINFFDCGGIAIGLCLSHQIADGASAIAFMNSWASTCRLGGKVVDQIPSFDLAEHFPIKPGMFKMTNFISQSLSLGGLVVPKEVMTKRFVFDKEKIAELRELSGVSSESNDVKDPTGAELVSAFIWKHFIEADISKKLYNITAATQAVNLRKRMDQPGGIERVFGNCLMNRIALFDHDRGVPQIHDLVRELRTSLSAVNDEYIRKSQREDGEGYLSDYSKAFVQFAKGGMNSYCGFSSWCGYPVYEVDYGWGKPVWVGTTAFSRLNVTHLMDTKSRDGGIEAWISTLPDNIRTLETQIRLL